MHELEIPKIYPKAAIIVNEIHPKVAMPSPVRIFSVVQHTGRVFSCLYHDIRVLLLLFVHGLGAYCTTALQGLKNATFEFTFFKSAYRSD